MITFRSRPRHLELRRTSSCSAIPANTLNKASELLSATSNTSSQKSKRKVSISKSNVSSDYVSAFCCGSVRKNPKWDKSDVFTKPANKAPIICLQPVTEGVEHISELVDKNCHFCDEVECSDQHKDCNKLKIVSRGQNFLC